MKLLAFLLLLSSQAWASYSPTTVLQNSSGTELGTSGNPIKVDGSGVAQPVSGTVTITPPTLTKGTQGSTGESVQELKDAGRTNVSLYAEAVAGAASEALITLNQSKAFASATTGTSYSVTAAKTLRITAVCVALVSTTTTANTARIRIRINTAGAAAVTSPIAWDMIVGWPSATFIANEAITQCHQFPDGIEVPAGSGVGVTHAEAAANGTVNVSLTGFEY